MGKNDWAALMPHLRGSCVGPCDKATAFVESAETLGRVFRT